MFGGRKYTQIPRYDAETGGRSPKAGSSGNGSSRGGATWKRYAILGTVALGLVVFFVGGGSGSGRAQPDSQLPDVSDDGYYNDPSRPGIESGPISQDWDETDVTHDPTKQPPPPSTVPVDADTETEPVPPPKSKPKPKPDQKPSPSIDPPAKTGPTSPADDPDPAKTTYCSTPHPGKKLVQYALMIDAGSTGSRIHIYKFNFCAASPQLEYEVFQQTRPGLSHYKDSPKGAAASLDELLDEAVKVVPESLHKCTPVAVKATAGLRLLGASQSDAILARVRSHLEDDYPFPLVATDPVVIMDGKDEGVYAWITANYLEGKIGESAPADADTLAVMDLGGASTQIVFEPTFKSDDAKMADGDHKYALTFGGRDFTLYQHSYLGYGLMQARRSIHNLVAFSWTFSKGPDAWAKLEEGAGKVEIVNPCLAVGKRKKVELDPPGRTKVDVTMVGGEGGYEACKRVVELVMAKDAICEVKPCSFNGVYQPALLDTFPRGTFLALSYFTDRLAPLLPPAATDAPTLNPLALPTVKALAKTVCAGEKVWRKKFKGNEVALKELEDKEEYCLDLTFMHALLGLGYEIANDRDLIIAKKMRDVELGWALGAGLAMLEGSLKCLV